MRTEDRSTYAMDWADTKAREWLVEFWGIASSREVEPSLAALLREVQRDMVPLSEDGQSVFIDGQGEVDLAPKGLAEVRRVVSECPLISEEARRALIRELEHV